MQSELEQTYPRLGTIYSLCSVYYPNIRQRSDVLNRRNFLKTGFYEGINLDVELTAIRWKVEFIIGPGERLASGEIRLTDQAKKVIELAVDEARRLSHHYIDTEHLLIGIMREGEGVAAGVLDSMGVNLERVRAEVARLSQN